MAEKQAATERVLNNVIAELQARNGLVPSNGGTQPKGIQGIIENGLAVVANAIQKIPSGGGDANQQVMSRLVDMALGGIQQNNQIAEVVKLGMAKQLGVDLGAATAKTTHMTVPPHV